MLPMTAPFSRHPQGLRHRVGRRLLPWLLPGLLAACAAPPPGPEPAVAALPERYPTAPQDRPAAEPPPALDWASLFADPDLQRLQAAALAANSDLKTSLATVEAARAAAGLQQAATLPLVALGGSGLRAHTRLPLDALPPPLSTLTQGIDPNVTLSHYAVGLALSSYEIDFWGKARAQNDAARAQYLASEEAQQAFRIGLLALVTDTWLQGLELQERLTLARATLANNAESDRIMRRRQQVGLVSDMETSQTAALLASTRSDLAALERQWAANRALLTQLTHESDPPRAHGQRPLTGLLAEPLPAGLPSELLLRRPDLRAAEQQLHAARANVQAARAAFLPSIALTAAGGVGSSALGDLFSHGTGSWLFLPQIVLPIFDGGRREQNLALAEARRHQAVAQYEAGIQTAFREVSELLAAQHWLAEQESAARTLAAAQTERARLAGKRYERGYAGYFEVLDAERGRFAAEQGLVQLHRARLSTRIGLFKALGGGALAPVAATPTQAQGSAL